MPPKILNFQGGKIQRGEGKGAGKGKKGEKEEENPKSRRENKPEREGKIEEKKSFKNTEKRGEISIFWHPQGFPEHPRIPVLHPGGQGRAGP